MAVRKEKSGLSKGVLQMKFMQRTAIQQLKDEQETQSIDEEHWYLAVPKELKGKPKVAASEESLHKLHNLRFGRQSYKGFNPEIERLAANIEKETDLDESNQKEKETSVNDEEMAERYASLVGTIGKKFAKKKKVKRAKGSDEEVEKEEVPKQKKKRKFMKPPE